MHTVNSMIALRYRQTPRHKWRTAFRMHLAGRENMEKEAKKQAAQNGWHCWTIEEQFVHNYRN